MPIEIREVIIKAEIRDGQENAAAPSPVGNPAEDKENIIRECVDQVLRIIEDRKAR